MTADILQKVYFLPVPFTKSISIFLIKRIHFTNFQLSGNMGLIMKIFRSFAVMATFVVILLKSTNAQVGGSFNFAKKTAGERDGDLTPSAIAGVSMACVAGLAGLVVTVFFCYYVYRQQKQYDSYNSSFAATAKI